MLSPWIARIVLATLAVEAGLCTAFLAEEWHPLRTREQSAFRRILKTSGDKVDRVLDPATNADRLRIARPLRPGLPSSYLRVDITDDPLHPLESSPPSPLDWCTILKSARTEPPGVAAIDQPLTWENADDLSLAALDHELSLYDRAVLCVDLRRAPIGQGIPDYLRRSAIPLSRLQGNASLLPRVNRFVFPPSATGARNVLFGFRLLENEDTTGGMPPAFARWDDVLVPSFPIALAMAQHGVTPAEVRIFLGDHIRLGNGPVIPIDEFGRILLPDDGEGRLLLPPSDQRNLAFATAGALAGSEFSSPFFIDQTPDCTLFTDALGLSPSPWGNPQNLQNIASAIDILPQPGPPVSHARFPLWLEAILLVLLATIAAAALKLRSSLRRLLFPALLLTSLGILILILLSSGAWTFLTPACATLLTAWLLSTPLKKHFPSHHS